VPVSTAHHRNCSEPTRRLFELCGAAGLAPRPSPKMIDFDRCLRCGRCVLGCPYGAKWDSRRFLDDALAKGARLFVDRVPARGSRLDKRLTAEDRRRLAEAEALCRDLLVRLGVDPADIFLGTLNAGHPGGMLPLTVADAATLHPARLPANLYVADATLLPCSLGNPPILAIMALAAGEARIDGEAAISYSGIWREDSP
jgi:choline dehydrogenase-like flavoprotein